MAEIAFDRGAVYTTFKLSGYGYEDISRIISIIDAVTSARPSGYQYMPSYKAKTWDGYIKLRKQSMFPSGLLSIVTGALRSNGYDRFSINNTYRFVDFDLGLVKPKLFLGITGRNYQLEATRLCLVYGRGILKMATNAGKTLVIAYLSRIIPGSILVLTTKRDLLHQTAERIENRLQEHVGLVGDGYWEPERITVGMVQTLSKHIASMKRTFAGLDCVIFDECHHIPSKTSQTIMYGLEAPMRYGFSGTPLRNDNLSDLVLMGATGNVLLEVTNEDLVRVGISAEPEIEMYVIDNIIHEGTWQEAYQDCIVDNAVRNDLIARKVLCAKANSTLILVDRIEHGYKLLDHLAVKGNIRSLFIHGSTPMDERIGALHQLRNGDGVIVIATNVFGEGVDVPAVDLLVPAGGGKGHIKLLQNVGRGMRSKDNGNVLHIIDFVDDTNEYLLNHSYIRAGIYEQEGFLVRIVE